MGWRGGARGEGRGAEPDRWQVHQCTRVLPLAVHVIDLMELLLQGRYEVLSVGRCSLRTVHATCSVPCQLRPHSASLASLAGTSATAHCAPHLASPSAPSHLQAGAAADGEATSGGCAAIGRTRPAEQTEKRQQGARGMQRRPDHANHGADEVGACLGNVCTPCSHSFFAVAARAWDACILSVCLLVLHLRLLVTPMQAVLHTNLNCAMSVPLHCVQPAAAATPGSSGSSS